MLMENQKKIEKTVEETGTKNVTLKKRNTKLAAKNAENNNEKSKINSEKPRRNNLKDKKVNDAFSEFSEKVVDIARVTKVVKGGRRFSFSAFVVVGNKKGRVGYGHGKANEVPDAIKKAIKDAQNNLVDVPLYNGTIPHETNAKFLASKVMLKPAPEGKGLIASGSVRAVAELAGYNNIVTKTYGSRSKTNIVKATVKALKTLRTPEKIAEIRDKDVKELL
nr:30S ribosomal protein S5 [Mycoplasmopsis anatis]